jgi:hypothetical protein
MMKNAGMVSQIYSLFEAFKSHCLGNVQIENGHYFQLN